MKLLKLLKTKNNSFDIYFYNNYFLVFANKLQVAHAVKTLPEFLITKKCPGNVAVESCKFSAKCCFHR